MANPNQKVIEKIGTEIIRCSVKECVGVALPNKYKGDYPRAFFLYPNDNSPMELAIIGMNPGKPQPGEKQRYINLAKQNKDGWATYKQCKEVWRGFAKEIDYYLKPRDFLNNLGLSLNGILYSEVVFCEKLPTSDKIDKLTFELCSRHYLKPKIAKLLSKCEHIFCLGNEAFDHVTKLPESNQWKVLRLYHPTPPAVQRPHGFAYYFKKDGKLNEKIRDDFERLEERQKPYKCKVNHDGMKEV